MAHNRLTHALSSLAALRDQWGFYTVTTPGLPAAAHAEAKEKLEYALKLWVLDAYYTAHDTIRRSQVKARLVQRKFPESVKREDIAEQVTARLRQVHAYVAMAPGLLHLAGDDIAAIRDTAAQYFAAPGGSFVDIPAEEGETLLRRFGAYVADADLL